VDVNSGNWMGVSLDFSDWIGVFCCSGIGILQGAYYLWRNNPKGKKMLLLSVVMSIVWGVVRGCMEIQAYN